ncbi:hypothetical protein GCM10025864_37770 [Luteimicrobium album]|uniref:Uncharacterized protein n=1 Tax=Luteimicrobium album TaxID=1054550 RepID=A0ABQ6I7U1_9MICO|nr:hypothetical protein GCM10025864_37770 [Luteimicrobium album]
MRPPREGIDGDGVRGGLGVRAEGRRQCLDDLAERAARGVVGRAPPTRRPDQEEQGARLLGRQPREIRPRSPDELPPAARPGCG